MKVFQSPNAAEIKINDNIQLTRNISHVFDLAEFISQNLRLGSNVV